MGALAAGNERGASGCAPAAAALRVERQDGPSAAIVEAASRADHRHSFLCPSWFAADAGPDLRSLIARRPDGSVIAALPLVRRYGVIAAVPGSYWPFRSFPVAADANDDELAAFLASPAAKRTLGLMWRIGPVRENDPTAARLLALAGRAGWTPVARSVGTAFELDLAALRREGSWPRTATLRKNRWLERKLAEQGDLEFTHFTGSGWTDALFETLAGIERRSWLASTGGRDAKFMAPRHRRFWEAAAADPEMAGRMHASVLTVGGIAAAFTFYLSTGPTLFLIANSYDERFRQQSPGRVLLYRDFQQAFESGVELIDWGAGDPGYKREMGARQGPAIIDCLFLRHPLLAAAVRPFWRG